MLNEQELPNTLYSMSLSIALGPHQFRLARTEILRRNNRKYDVYQRLSSSRFRDQWMDEFSDHPRNLYPLIISNTNLRWAIGAAIHHENKLMASGWEMFEDAPSQAGAAIKDAMSLAGIFRFPLRRMAATRHETHTLG